MKFEEWLCCPYCDADDADSHVGVEIEIDGEHVTLTCEYCESSESIHRWYVEWIGDDP